MDALNMRVLGLPRRSCRLRCARPSHHRTGRSEAFLTADAQGHSDARRASRSDHSLTQLPTRARGMAVRAAAASSAPQSHCLVASDDYERMPGGEWSSALHFGNTQGFMYFSYECDSRSLCSVDQATAGYCKVNATLLYCCVVSAVIKYEDELFLQVNGPPTMR